jgi:hypothetical protein
MKINDTAKGCGCVVLFIIAYLGWCYLEQAARHRWAPRIAEEMAKVPGARLVSSFDGGKIINPVSWFWPAEYTIVYARPDILAPDLRFYVMMFSRDDKHEQPSTLLVSVNCKSRTEIDYFPAQAGDKGELAMTVIGQPVVAPDGTIYRRYDTHVPPPSDQLKAFCETDWTPERQAVANDRRPVKERP